MAKKKKKFKFTFAVFLRFIIFLSIITIGIMYFSNSQLNLDTNIKLPNLPYVNNISSNPAIIQTVDQLKNIQSTGTVFINDQIKEIKKSFAEKLANEIKNRIIKE